MIFGLTGGIASGKSTATKVIRSFNIPIVDADVVARQVVEVGTPGWGIIRAMFGHEYLNEDETINRTKLGELVFNDEKAMYSLNGIMGPLIRAESLSQLLSLEKEYSIVGYDAALICEMGNADMYRPLIVVFCDRESQLTRLMARNNLTKEQAIARIDAQMPVEQKVKMADYVINTSGSLESSAEQTRKIITTILNK